LKAFLQKINFEKKDDLIGADPDSGNSTEEYDGFKDGISY
jgi:hypothetical protein